MRARTVWAGIGLSVLGLLVAGFAIPSGLRGVNALAGDVDAIGRFGGTALSDLGLFSHMITGGFVSLLALLQWSGYVRRRWPRTHRLSGRILVPTAMITAIGGLTYIAVQGTIGGPLMSLGFALYGLLMFAAALMTWRYARAGAYAIHRRWGLRLIVLALGSWLYRLHYGLWYGITCAFGDAYCGMGSRSDFLGPFDLVQNVAFYLPYLLILELVLRREKQPVLPSRMT